MPFDERLLHGGDLHQVNDRRLRAYLAGNLTLDALAAGMTGSEPYVVHDGSIRMLSRTEYAERMQAARKTAAERRERAVSSLWTGPGVYSIARFEGPAPERMQEIERREMTLADASAFAALRIGRLSRAGSVWSLTTTGGRIQP